MYAGQMAPLGICYHLFLPLEHGLCCPFRLSRPVWLLVSQLPDNHVYPLTPLALLIRATTYLFI